MRRYTEVKTICWVYITRHPKTGEEIVAHALDLADDIARHPHLQLLYYRQFENITDAMAHKLLLEELSYTSVHAIISRMNPQSEDLRKEINIIAG